MKRVEQTFNNPDEATRWKESYEALGWRRFYEVHGEGIIRVCMVSDGVRFITEEMKEKN